MNRLMLIGGFIFCAGILSVSAGASQPNWVCYANPSPAALEACERRGVCEGAGTYSVDKEMSLAALWALTACNAEYFTDECSIEYCERVE